MDWRTYYKEHTMTPEQAVSVIKDGDRVVFGHAVGEPIIFQRTMARLAEQFHQVEVAQMLSKTELLKTLPESKQIAYITKSLLNRARRVYANRIRYKITDEIETDLADRSIDPALLFDKKAATEAFRRALERLSDRDRELLLDKYFADLPDAAIADLVGLKPASIRSALTRARRALKKELEKELEDE